ncbi:MAG: hypothetical protein ACRYGR_06555 [Janthinobacterium lividum]
MNIKYKEQKKYEEALECSLKAIENGFKKANLGLFDILGNNLNLNLNFETKKRILDVYLEVMENGEFILPTSFNSLFDIRLEEDTLFMERLCSVFFKILQSIQDPSYIGLITPAAMKLSSKPNLFSKIVLFGREQVIQEQPIFLDNFYKSIIGNYLMFPQKLVDTMSNFCFEEIENATSQANLASEFMEKIIRSKETSEELQKKYFEPVLKLSASKNYEYLKNIALSAIFTKSHITSIKHVVLDHLILLAQKEPEKFLSSKVGDYLSIVNDLCIQSKFIKPEHNNMILDLLLTAVEKGDLKALDYTIREVYDEKINLNSDYEDRFYKCVVQNIEHLTGNPLNNVKSLFSGKIKWLKPNLRVVIEHIGQAADKGNLAAMILLGHTYLGIEPSTNENINAAYFWLKKAKNLGSNEAEKYLILAESLSSVGDNDEKLTKIFEEQDLLSLRVQIKSSEFNDKIENEFKKPEELENNKIEILKRTKVKTRKQAEPKLANNSKYQRSKLMQLGQIIRNQKVELENACTFIELSKRSKELITAIFETKNIELSYNDLKNLFEDEFFKNQIIVTHSNNKLMIAAHNLQTGEYKTASTHDTHEHRKTVNIAFKEKIKEILIIFGLS